MTALDDRLESMLDKLRGSKYRITPQRLAVLRILVQSDAHPSVEDIYQEVIEDFPTTSLATVYKTVTLLKELGEVLEIGFGDGRSRYDGYKPYAHPHLICLQCRRIIDPDLGPMADMTAKLARDTGFRIVNHRLDFFGICPDCQADAE